MGIVNESEMMPTRDVVISRTAEGTVPYKGIRNFDNNYKQQRGYRSGPLSKQEKAAISELDRNGTKKDIVKQLNALDRIRRATTNTPLVREDPFIVNEREYISYEAPAISISSKYFVSGREYRTHGGARIVSLRDNLPSFPVHGQLEGEAASMMRSIRPTRPDFDLTRFIGELRDAPRLLGFGNYSPRSSSDIGGAYLNYQFGLAPTASDIQKMADSVLKADELTKQFIQESSRVVRRQSRRIIDEISDTRYIKLGNGARRTTIGGITLDSELGGTTNHPGPDVLTYYSGRRELRVFSNFEYYVGDPTGYTDRMDDYARKARKLLGGGLTPSVIYELTPWSWMVDWFYDIGGLLAYQQDVADASLVSRGAGYVVEDTYHASARFGPKPAPIWFGAGRATAVKKRQQRWPGSPYTLKPNWDLSGFQWAILGALGLTRAPGIPFRGRS